MITAFPRLFQRYLPRESQFSYLLVQTRKESSYNHDNGVTLAGLRKNSTISKGSYDLYSLIDNYSNLPCTRHVASEVIHQCVSSSSKMHLTVHKELVILLSKLLKYFSMLPLGLCSMNHISLTRQLFLSSFSRFVNFPVPSNVILENKFCQTIKDEQIIYEDFGILCSMSLGIQELRNCLKWESLNSSRKESCSDESNDMISEEHFFRKCLGILQEPLDHINLVLSHYKFLLWYISTQSEMSQISGVNLVARDLDLAVCLRLASSEARNLCLTSLGDSPSVQFNLNKSPPQRLYVYMGLHLQYILLEILKNAFRATVETYRKRKKHVHDMNITMPPVQISVTSCDNSNRFCICISDEGGGIPYCDLDSVLNYLFTTSSEVCSVSEESNSTSPPLAGFGWGLPMSRVLCRFHNGDLHLQSREGMDLLDRFPALEASVLWSDLLEYERVDIINGLGNIINNTLFRSDNLVLKEYYIDQISGPYPSLPSHSHYLGLEGTAHQEHLIALQYAVEHVVSKTLRNFSFNVLPGVNIGSYLPNISFQVLIETNRIRAMRWWHKVRMATCCGVIHQMTALIYFQRHQRRASLLISPAHATFKKESMNQPPKENSSNTNEPRPSAGRSATNFKQFYKASEIEIFPIKWCVGSLQTVFVFWSSGDAECMSFIRKWFTTAKSSTTPEYVLWKQLQPYFTAEKSIIEDDVLHNSTASFCSKELAFQRGHFEDQGNIVFVSLDVSREKGVKAAKKLLMMLPIMRRFSPVSLTWMWSGENTEILSSFRPHPISGSCFTILNGRRLPVLMLVLPPRSVFHQSTSSSKKNTTDESDTMPYRPQVMSFGRIPSDTPSSLRATDDDQLGEWCKAGDWVKLTDLSRKETINNIYSGIKETDAPLNFRAERLRYIYHTNPTITQKKLTFFQNETTLNNMLGWSSRIRIRGWISSSLIQKMVSTLSSILLWKETYAYVNIVQMANPLVTKFEPLTPRHRVCGFYRSISCSHCSSRINTQSENHYYCLFCSQEINRVCMGCFQSQAHDQNHILVHLPPMFEERIELLWGVPHFSNSEGLSKRTEKNKTILALQKQHRCDWCHKRLVDFWRCCCCHESEVCDKCYLKWRNDDTPEERESKHPSKHVFMQLQAKENTPMTHLWHPKLISLKEYVCTLDNVCS